MSTRLLRKRVGKIPQYTNIAEIYGGTWLTDHPNVADALKATGLDWDTQICPICLSDKLRTKFSGVFGTYRRAGPSQNIPLGVVRGRYRPVHNRESFAWLDSILGGKLDAKIIAGGMWGEGKRVWVAVDLGSFEVVPGDEVRKIMVVMNSNDGSSHWLIHFLPARPACWNMLNFHSPKGAYKIRHTAGAGVKLEEIKNIVKMALGLYADFEKTCKTMAKCKVSQEQIDQVVYRVLGVSPTEVKEWAAACTSDNKDIVVKQPQWVNQRDAMLEMVVNGPGSEHAKGTLWPVYNGVQGYFDHVRTVRGSEANPDNLYESKISGYSAVRKVETYEVCTSLLEQLGKA